MLRSFLNNPIALHASHPQFLPLHLPTLHLIINITFFDMIWLIRPLRLSFLLHVLQVNLY